VAGLLLLLLRAQHTGGQRGPPNILFIIDESTSSRAYAMGAAEGPPMPLPNLSKLMAQGVSFNQTYVSAPVCCPNRASIWSGRHAHNIPHVGPDTGELVHGVWNNQEGLDPDYAYTIDQLLASGGGDGRSSVAAATPYELNLNGLATARRGGEGPDADFQTQLLDKLDRYSAGHTVNVKVEAWTNKVNFPYNMSFIGVHNKEQLNVSGWADETGPLWKTVSDSEAHYERDWNATRQLADWIRERRGGGAASPPWFGYIGMNIVHPDYVSDEGWLSRVNASHPQLRPPAWPPVASMHPEDFRASLLKGMGGEDTCCSDEYKVEVRRHYFAMIAEFDAMVGELMAAVEESGQAGDTMVIVTSDHGDMNMEHRQYYKMDWHDGSVRVPLIIAGPAVDPSAQGTVTNELVSTIDLFPTILDLARVPLPAAAGAQGASLVPFLQPLSLRQPPSQPLPHQNGDWRVRRWVLSQFAGDNLHLPWYALTVQAVRATRRRRRGSLRLVVVENDESWYKYVAYGSGHDVPHRLFDLGADPDETRDLGRRAEYAGLTRQLDALLDEVIAATSGGWAGSYREVSESVESYNKRSFAAWRAAQGSEAAYRAVMSSQLRWAPFWQHDSEGCFAAIERWLADPSNDTAEWDCSYPNPPQPWHCRHDDATRVPSQAQAAS